ncbi:MAG: ketol-acid reductoisomerase [Bdellovibrionota bacterium]
MVKMYTDKEIDQKALQGKKIAVLGYGSQGRGQALNLRDSGLNVVLGLRPGGKTWAQAESDGWKPVESAAAVQGADVVAMLVPDMAQPALYKEAVEPNVKKGAMVLFSHGFNVHYGQIKPNKDIDVAMIAPKGPGKLVRDQYVEGRGVPCLVAVAQNASGQALERALAYGQGVGGGRGGIIETTFGEETETDLFGEQAVLCGGATELVCAGWETLVNAGYKPEVAYFECLHELKLIVDLLYEGGIARMHEFISDTAKFGDLTRGPRIVDQHVKDNMKKVLTEIQDGTFAQEWILENQAGAPRYAALLKKDLAHPVEEVGKVLRSRMSWLKKD